MAAGNRRTRDHLLIVLNLYLKLRFGQFDGKQPVIVDLAMRIGRTPGAVAMELSNGISARKPSATGRPMQSGRIGSENGRETIAIPIWT
jgi:putative restriction endonuclease